MPTAVRLVLMVLQVLAWCERLFGKGWLQERWACCLQAAAPLLAHQHLLLVAVPESLHACDACWPALELIEL